MWSVELGGLQRIKMPLSNARYLVRYRAIRRVTKILEGRRYIVIKTTDPSSVLDFVGIRQSDIVGIKLLISPHNNIPNVQKLRENLRKINAPANFTKEIWVWEHKRGFHYFNLES